MRQVLTGLGLAALCLVGACNQGGEDAGADASAAADPSKGPQAKAGLWNVSLKSDAIGEQSSKVCIGEDANLLRSAGAPDDNACSERTTARTASGWTMHAVCTVGEGITSTLDSEITGDPQSHITMTMRINVVGAPGMEGVTQTIVSDMTREGDCPADMPPGAVDNGQMIIDGSKMKAPGAG